MHPDPEVSPTGLLQDFFVLIFAIIFFSFLSLPRAAQAVEIAGTSAILKSDESIVDTRIVQLEKYLESFSSPLSPYAEEFITAADKYGLDWRLVPAITGVESTFGKRIPYNSYNAYGWANGDYKFGSWEESINHVSKVLSEKYVARGLNTPYKIGPVYAPPSKTWAGKVDHFMKEIDQFATSVKVVPFWLTI